MVKLNRIYTRTGDDGTSGLVDGSRVSKAAPLMAAIGDVDETNSVIGVAATLAVGDPGDLAKRLATIQNDLFDLGADIATPDAPMAWEPLRIVVTQVTRLEDEIDAMNEAVPPLTSFVLPGGSPLAAALHVARATARRAERSAVTANLVKPLNPHALAYLNRLSDWLFVAARAANANGADDVLWVPGASR